MERQAIPLFPLNTVLFPGMKLPLHIFEERYKLMLKHCLEESIDFGVVLLKSGRAEEAFSGEVHDIGTTAAIKQVESLPDNRFNIVATGARRFRIVEIYRDQMPYPMAEVEYYPIEEGNARAAVQMAHKLAPLIGQFLQLFRQITGRRFSYGQLPVDPMTLAFLVGVILPVENEVKQEILSQPDAFSILKTEYDLMKHETLVMQMIQDSRPNWAMSDNIIYYPN